MHRFLLALVLVCVFAAMVLPATASATKWVVKSPSGAKMGTVVKKSSRVMNVYNRTGAKRGRISSDDGYIYHAAMWLPGDQGVRKEAEISKRSFGTYSGWWIVGTVRSGVARKVNGRWVIRGGSSNLVRGRVSGRCPGWAAGGAVFILSKKLR